MTPAPDRGPDATAVLQAVLDAIKGTLDPHTQIADHPNVKFAQMERLTLVARVQELEREVARLREVADKMVQWARLDPAKDT